MKNSKIYYDKGIIKQWNSGMITQSQLSQIQFYATIDNAENFYQILRAVAFTETAAFQIGAHGIKVTVEEAQAVQASAYINKNNGFLEYRYKELNDEEFISFSVNLKVIVENLNMFSEKNSRLKILYKGEGSPLVMILESEDENLITEFSIKTRQLQSLLDLQIDDSSDLVEITFKGYGFYNLMNDLFKTVPGAAEVEILVGPRYFKTISRSSVEAVVEYKMDRVSEIILSFKCENEVSFKFESSNIKLLLKTLQIATTTTLSLDKHGMLGVRVMKEHENQFQSHIEYVVVPLEDNNE